MKEIWLICWTVVTVLTFKTKCQDYDLMFPGKFVSTNDTVQSNVNTSEPFNAFTVCLWLRPFQNTSNYQVIMSLHPNKTAPNDFTLLYDTSDQSAELWIFDKRVKFKSPNLLTGTWHHVCVTWNTSYGRWMMMIDGEVCAENSLLSEGFAFSSNEIIDLGQGNARSESQRIAIPFNGQISSLYFWVYELKLSEMRKMFERCQPSHQTDSAVNWSVYLGQIGERSAVTILKPSRCHTKENLALYRLNSNEYAKVVTDGLLNGAGYNSSQLHITLSHDFWISEVLVYVGTITAPLFLSLNGNKCGSTQVTHSWSAAVIYCINPKEHIFNKKITIYSLTNKYTLVDFREVLIFWKHGQGYKKPFATFPLSKSSPEAVTTSDVRLVVKDSRLRYGFGVDDQLDGSTRFSSSIDNAIKFSIPKNDRSFFNKAFTISAWINLDTLPIGQATVFSFDKVLFWPSITKYEIPIKMEIEKDQIRANFGRHVLLLKMKTLLVSIPFKTGIWYHIGMTYSSTSQLCCIFRDEALMYQENCDISSYITASAFKIGSFFPGRISCFQIFSSSISGGMLRTPLSYSCLNGQAATPPPILLFPFSSNATYKNVQDVTMTTRLSGTENFAERNRKGIISEPWNGMKFSPNGLSSLIVEPENFTNPLYGLTVAFWLKYHDINDVVNRTCYIYRQSDFKIELINRAIVISFVNLKQDGELRSGQIRSTKKGFAWMFVVFSYRNHGGGIASLEINGNLEDQKSLDSSKYFTLKMSGTIEIGKGCNIWLACFQVYNAPLTKSQTAMAKYRCVNGREGIYNRIESFDISVVPPDVFISWNSIYYAIRGLRQGYHVKVSDSNNSVVKVVTTRYKEVLLDGLQPDRKYFAQIQAFGQQNGPLSSSKSFIITSVFSAPNITGNTTGATFVNITWKRSHDKILGYILRFSPMVNATTPITVMVCSNKTYYTFTNLTAMTHYQVDIRAFDGKVVGKESLVFVETYEEAPRKAPVDVRAFNVRVDGINQVYINWHHYPHSDLRGTIKGFKIRAWLQGENVSHFETFDSGYNIKTSELDINKNYTIRVYGVTGNDLMGPGSFPISNHEEKAAFLPPRKFTVKVTACGSVILKWGRTYEFPLSGINRMFRITYYNSTAGQNFKQHIFSSNLWLELYGLTQGVTYTWCVAAQTIPNSPFGPCTEDVRLTISCQQNSTSNVTSPTIPLIFSTSASTFISTSTSIAPTPTSIVSTSTFTSTSTSTSVPPTPAPTSIASTSTSTTTCRLTSASTLLHPTPTPTSFFGRVSEWSSWSVCNQTCGTGFSHRSRVCLLLVNSSCIEQLHESQQCNENSCLEDTITLSIDANFTEEKWDDNLADVNSSQFKEFQTKTCQNIQEYHGSLTCFVEKCWKGSVMATLHANFSTLNARQVLKLQESLEIDGTLGNMSVVLQKVYSSSVPTEGPEIISLKAITAVTAQVNWKPIDATHLHGVLQRYTISYRTISNLTWTIVPCGIDCTSIVIDHLQPLATYRFRVQALSNKGSGIAGGAVELKMPALVSKNIPPPNVMASASTSTAIEIQWGSLPDGVISGKFLGYRVLCAEEKSGKVIIKETQSWVNWLMVGGLNKFEWYSIRVLGYSDQGMGFSNPSIRVRTLEDIPSAHPSNAVIHDKWDTSSLEIRWDPVPVNHRNGIILGYKLKYKLVNPVDQDETHTRKTLLVSPSENHIILQSLESSANYEVELLAYTVKGDGLAIKLAGETCKCNKDIYTNYWSYPPYLITEITGTPGGIFGSIVQDMITNVCGDCINGHRKSTVHFTNDGKGNHALKPSQAAVNIEIDDITDVSFPVRGYVTDTTYLKYYSYISLVESPGIAYLAIRQEPTVVKNNTLYDLIMSCWMLLVLMFTIVYLVGMVIWVTDCRSNPDHFPAAFHRGAWEGMWYSFMSMTTVG